MAEQLRTRERQARRRSGPIRSAMAPRARERSIPLKVLHLVDNFSAGGAAVGVLNLVQTTADRVKHGVLSLAPAAALAEQLPAGTQLRALLPGQNRLFGFVARLARWVRQERFDVLHVNNLAAWLDAALAARWTGRPCVQTFHGLECSVEEIAAGQRWKCFIAGKLTTLATAVGEASRDALCRLAGLPRESIEVIRNGIDLRRFRPTPSPHPLPQGGEGRVRGAAIRKEVGVGDHSPLAVHVAGLRPVKDQLTLLSAWRLVVAQSDVPPVLLIVGEGPCRDWLMTTALQLGIARQVRFLGQREDVHRILPACEVFVLSSLTEGLSLAILEAMACGLPVVATSVGGNGELVREGVTGRLVPAGDAEKLALALLDVLNGPAQALAMSRAAREHVEAHYDLEQMAQRYVDLYESLLVTGRRRKSSNQIVRSV